MNTLSHYLKPYELQQLPDGSLQQIFIDSEEMHRFRIGKKESIEFVNEYFEQISETYPWHINGIEQMLNEMDKTFVQAKKHPFIYKARIAEQSAKCLFGNIDNIPDRDERGLFHVEHVHCPHRGRCKWDGYAPRNKHLKCVVCNPIMANNLNDAEYEVAILLSSPYTVDQIAHLREVKPTTIMVQRLSIYRKLNITSREQLIDLVKTQRLR